MKKLILLTLLVIGTALTVKAGGSHRHGHGGSHHHSHSSVSFHVGAYPYYSSWYSRPYAYYPSFGFSYPAYGYGYPGYGYSYGRPNYAVGGTLTGAMLGGIIGSANNQGWEGAGIGAAAGLVLGGIAERSARAQERAAFSQPAYIPDAPAINTAPTVPQAGQVPAAPRVQPVSSMKAANSLFGR